VARDLLRGAADLARERQHTRIRIGDLRVEQVDDGSDLHLHTGSGEVLVDELYMVSTDDKMIPPPAQREMAKRAGSTVVESKGSHAIYVSQRAAVAEFIEKAAKSLAMK
jgi:hypothetical protein